jgi:hypothetical protein
MWRFGLLLLDHWLQRPVEVKIRNSKRQSP